MSIVDAMGNAVSMTTTINDGFGAQLMAAGFHLNNVHTNFSPLKFQHGPPFANRMEANKRPYTAMAPTLVFDPQGKLKLVVGSAGASSIVDYVAQIIVSVIAWGMELQPALNQPHYGNQAEEARLEADTPIAQLAAELEAKGHKIHVKAMQSGVSAILLQPSGLIGGADLRRDGTALGH
jgi:gamma-glutamyltranspeptidase/glutathione hydrolase